MRTCIRERICGLFALVLNVCLSLDRLSGFRSLPCQSNSWKNSSGSETGIRGIYGPLKGKSISCTAGGSFYASVDSNGTPYARIYKPYSGGFDTGYLAITEVVRGAYLSGRYTVKVSTNGVHGHFIKTDIGDNGDTSESECFTPWPMT